MAANIPTIIPTDAAVVVEPEKASLRIKDAITYEISPHPVYLMIIFIVRFMI